MRTCIVTAVAAVLFAASAAHAAAEQGLASAILACAAQADEKTQLACYNSIAAQLKGTQAAAVPSAASAAPAAPQSVPTAPQPVPQQAAQAPSHEGGAWYNPGTWFGSNEPASAPRPTIGSPADFGSESMPETKTDAPQPLDQITAKVVSVSYNFFRRFTVTLDNGQVWRQAEGDSVARFSDDGGEAVTIKRGFLGSFNLTIVGKWGTYQVKRIK